ncbi:hypothetical protein HBI56_181320 [Parastagonospora nodorum]|uniref:FAD/NAD(P)-binding domain-containing protein n=1 Tax=Phaeosphaeria nodorum (strain SN15 / ATCC MYA-4574 / FGSC 10173) TaxID=321614 RepID=A0A7U2F923_PHANO|nr:hypothetical protein HBH56_186700 [Parastagonospora nodorum]QRD00998.1 hypothetical protein JI435_154020 [Parastagonospora nodorum SN15]KAH3925290.1 hypothetical protein HBH54_181850 [Parastagonospora nodorum]KAH3962164.1 hypothetical protein HBH52_227260 [Parastagonospora nodorum]KAH3992127.1 hypothetical protein HBI10_222940 [Parastagonospora nodorum]
MTHQPAPNGSSHSPNTMVQSHVIDAARPMRIVCIGAGISGICTGIRFPQEIKNLDLVIYEKNSDVGGTWYENRYPGVRCDIPSAGYQFTFENNSQWSEFLAGGAEIQEYLTRTAKKYGVYNYCKFNHMFRSAKWHQDRGKWEVVVENLITHETFADTADVVLTASGILNKWDWPNIPGIHSFRVPKLHTACWDDSIDVEDKHVAVIGGGSSGIQLVPTLQPRVKHMDHYMKGKNWISPLGMGSGLLKSRGIKTGNFKHTAEELEQFRGEPDTYLTFRRKVEQELNAAQLSVFMGTQMQIEFYKMALDSHKSKLKDRPDIYDALTPSWVPGCRRLTPGPGYLEACCAENVEFISTDIKMIHANSIETIDGICRPIDILCCATGFDVQRKELDITGLGGKTLNELWKPYPEAYLSVCPLAMPNLFMYLGPNGGPLAGSTVQMIEWVCDYMIQLVQKMQREYIKSMVISPQANAAFSAHVNQYFKTTIFTQSCASWYKQGKSGDSRVVTPWPGSSVHARKALRSPRYEDFIYEVLPEVQDNCLAWLGNGMTQAQMQSEDTTDYLDGVAPGKM